MTLEDFLRNSGTFEFRIRITKFTDGSVEGYIVVADEPEDSDKGTIDFAVKGNNLIVMQSQPSQAMLPFREKAA
jgi:hypothetical protein